jgi:ATP-binding protein involved in chromosome partitioning
VAPTQSVPSVDAVKAALNGVHDPEINRPITELGMVKDVTVAADGTAKVAVWLTVAGCPMRDTITSRVTTAVSAVPGIRDVQVELDVMSDAQRTALRQQLRGTTEEPRIPFAEPGSLTRVYCIASGKGGVGKSSVTVNLAVAMADRGLSVGVVDADIYGHSVPGMLGTTARPTQVEKMIMPPAAHGVKVISIGMFTKDNTPVVWRGPMLHRALQQFLADVFWGDLDVLLLDLPRGHHSSAGCRGGGAAGRVNRLADPPAADRSGGEHVLAGDAGRLAQPPVRFRRGPGGRRRADPVAGQ